MRYSKVLLPLAIVSSLCSFAFAEADTLSSQSPKKSKDCTSGSYGLGNGDGYNGYCCKTQADCWDDCINGVCNGKDAPNKSTTTSTKTKTKSDGPAPTCSAGSYDKKNGDGYNGYCCKTQADCWDDCINGVCNGKDAPNKSTTTSTKTKTKSDGPAPTCSAGSYDKKNGDGYNGYCCKTQADCWDDCINGVCNGKDAPNKSTTTSTKTKTKSDGPAPTCSAGSYDKKNGDGYNGYCCKTQADCWDDCINGVCNGKDAPNKSTTTSTKTKTDGPAPSSCTSGSYGKKNGDGYKGFCCKTQADCQDDCINGVCNGDSAPSKTKSNDPAPTNCTSGYRGKGRGNGPKNACCSSQADCVEDCVKSKCT